MKKTIAITNWVQEHVLEQLSAHFDVVANRDIEPWRPEVLRSHLQKADGVIAFMNDSIDEEVLKLAPKLKIVSCCLKGPDSFDIEACTRHGVLVTVLPDLLSAPGAELAVGLMIAAGRHLKESDAYVRSGAHVGWRPIFYGKGLSSSAVGIVGFGAIGQSIAQLLVPFRSKVRYWDRRRLDRGDEGRLNATFQELPHLLSESDFIVLALSLARETRHLMGADRLRLVKSDAILVNVARGSLVDEAAVAEALASGRLGFYASDVFQFEDWSIAGRPCSVEPALLSQRDRTLFTPHLGSAVRSIREDMAMQSAKNIIDFFAGYMPIGALNGEGMNLKPQAVSA